MSLKAENEKKKKKRRFNFLIIFCVYICIQLMNQKNGTTLSFSWLVNVKHFLLLFLFLLWISQRGFACMIVLLRERDHKEDFIKMMLLLKTWILVLKSNHRDESWKKKGTEESDIYMCMYKSCKCIAWKCVITHNAYVCVSLKTRCFSKHF